MQQDMRASTSTVALNLAKGAQERTALEGAFDGLRSSFETFCLVAGLEAFQDMLEQEASELCGERYQRHDSCRGRRWGTTHSQVAYSATPTRPVPAGGTSDLSEGPKPGSESIPTLIVGFADRISFSRRSLWRDRVHDA